MIKIDSDIKYIPWILAGIVVALPISMFFPLALPFILGWGLVYFGVKQILKYKSLLSWEKTKGTLIKTDTGMLEEAAEYSMDKYFVPLAYFSYEWDNVEHKSNTYAFDNKSIRSKDAEEVNISISKNRKSHAYALLASGVLVTLIGAVVLITT